MRRPLVPDGLGRLLMRLERGLSWIAPALAFRCLVVLERRSGREGCKGGRRNGWTRTFQNANAVIRRSSQPCRHWLMFVVPYVRGW